MLYPKNKEKELTQELFRDPGSEYRGTPFWAWNCRVTEGLIDEQLEIFKKMGFGGVHLHPRTGMENDYLGSEYMKLVRHADEKAKEKGMLIWLYDEDRYPSGSAGGIVTEKLEFRARHLLLTRERKTDMCESIEEFERKVVEGGKPAGYFLTAYRIKTVDGCLVSYRQIEGEIPELDTVQDEKKEGKLWLAYVELMRESPWYNDQTYVDVLNKKAVEKFIEITHEKYYRELGEEFGKSIPAIFTDEPQIKGSMALPDGESDYDVTLPFTDDLPQTFEESWGTPFLQVLPEILWELPEGRVSVNRYHYHDHLAERFVSSYSDTIAEWCGEHGIAMTGHYMSEPTLYSQTLRLGEAMRCYRNQQIPGVDILCGDPEYSTVKQAVSVARQKGREAVICELYGVTNWDFDFKGHKVQGDWLAALGVTVRCHHLSFMSMEGEAKRDWPASINYQSPWYGKYSYIENYFARVNTALTRGKADVKVGVIHPIESYWISYGPVAQTQDIRDQLDLEYKELMEFLLFGMIDFDLISESLLGGKDGAAACPYPRRDRERQRPEFRVGEMSYRTILVPGLRTIRSSTLEKLEQFAAAGGNIIFAGRIPQLVDALPSQRAAELAAGSKVISFDRREILAALDSDRSVEIQRMDGRLTDDLFYQMREDGGTKWLFVCHVNQKKTRLDQAQELLVRIRGEYEVTACDALSGEISKAEAGTEKGWTYIKTVMYAQDSLLWKLSERESDAGIGEEDEKRAPIRTGERISTYGLVAGPRQACTRGNEILKIIYEPDSYSMSEPNVLCLDKAVWKLDDGPEHRAEEILRLDNEIRHVLGYPLRQDACKQPWCIKEAPEDHTVTLKYAIKSEVDSGELLLAMERPWKAELWWNGERVRMWEHPREEARIACEGDVSQYFVDSFIRTVQVPPLKKGENELILRIPFGRRTNLENLYILGDFGVEVRGTSAEVTSRTEKLYFGDITRQKFPFYGGNVNYRMHFELENEGKAAVRVPHFAASVLEVFIDGRSAGLIAFAPHTLQAGVLAAGVHTLEICAYGNRFNTFGMLHNANPEYKWYGPDSYRTAGSDWSEAWCLRPAGILSRVEILSA